jgi:hypothetical protein
MNGTPTVSSLASAYCSTIDFASTTYMRPPILVVLHTPAEILCSYQYLCK